MSIAKTKIEIDELCRMRAELFKKYIQSNNRQEQDGYLSKYEKINKKCKDKIAHLIKLTNTTKESIKDLENFYKRINEGRASVPNISKEEALRNLAKTINILKRDLKYDLI